MITRIVTYTVFLFLLCACADDKPVNTQSWDKEIKLNKATDINSADNIVEINLTAAPQEVEITPGVKTLLWTYNNSFPGPTIEANVGDILKVNFTNNLPVATTIHWHGLELPANMDGSSIAQPTVSANGGTFTYEFKLNNAATYWYHPHVDSNVQVEMGLYGALIVRDPAEKNLGLPEKETVIIFDDILLDENGQVEPPSDLKQPIDPIKNTITQLNGRESDLFLVNGHGIPTTTTGEHLRTLDVTSGEPIRIRMINAANARFFRFSIPGYVAYQIGNDSGLLPTPRPIPPIPLVNNTPSNKLNARNIRPRDGEPLDLYSNPSLEYGIMLVPGERADIVFTPIGNAEDTAYMEWHFFPRGYHGVSLDENNQYVINHDHQPAQTLPFRLLRFKMDDKSKGSASSYAPPGFLKSTLPIAYDNNTPILPITFGHSMQADANGNFTFFATTDSQGNGIPFSQITEELALKAKVGQTYIWEITNLTQGDHPFHPHGFSFQHISTKYIDAETPENNRIEYPSGMENKDTIRIPGRPGKIMMSKTIVRLAAKIEDTGREGTISAGGKIPGFNTSGGWFVHCHILEHSTKGMGTYLSVSY